MGAATGAVSAGAGQIFSASSFLATVGNGALAGAGSSGIVSLINGTNFLEGLVKGAVIGGAVAAVSYTVGYFANGKYKTKSTTINDVKSGNENVYDPNVSKAEMQKNIAEMRNENFTSVEKDQFGAGFDQLGPGNSKGYLYKDESSVTLGYTRTGFFSGKAVIQYSPIAAQNKALLAEVMVHETGHTYANKLGLLVWETTKSKGGYDLTFDSRLNTTEHIAIYKLEHLYALKNMTFNGASMWNITTTYNLLSGLQQKLIDKTSDWLYPVFNRVMKY